MTENTTNENVNNQNQTTTGVDNSVDAFISDLSKDSRPTREITFNRFSNPFKIQALTGDEVNDLQKQATVAQRDPRTQQTVKSVDQDKLTDLMLAKSVINPPLDNEKLQTQLQCIGKPAEVLRKMLLAGEYAAINQEVQDLSGFYENINSDSEAAKK